MAIYTPEPKTIYNLLSDTIYAIPKYQRPYKWNDEQLEKLWEDLIESYELHLQENNDDEYFLGTIVVVGDEKNKERDVVDGQQRLTTLFIMTTILKKFFEDVNQNNDNDIIGTRIKKKTLIQILENEDEKPRIKTRERDRTYFDNLVINAKNEDILKYKYTKKELKDEDPQANYKNTMLFFYNKFRQYKNNNNDFDKLINYIYNNVVVIRISCLDATSALKVFQTINDTGLDLSIADIVKSMFMSSLNEDSQFGANWDEITKTLNKDGLAIDQFLIDYLYYRKEANPKKATTLEYEDLIKECKKNKEYNENIKKADNANYEKEKKETLDDIVNDMKIFADKFHDIYTEQNSIIYSLKYIVWQPYVNAIIGTIKKHISDDAEIEKYLKTIRRFYYLYFIAGKTATSIKQTSFNIIKYIKHQSYDELKKLLDDKINEDEILVEVKNNLNDSFVFGEKWLKSIMLSYDYTLTDCEKIFIPIDNRLNMDHIIPKEWRINSWWCEQLIDNEQEVNDKLNSIGNMALLSEHKNKAAQNVGLDIKQYIYLGQNIKENENGEHELVSSVTGFETTRYVINTIFKKDNKWNLDKMKERSKNLLEGIYNLLDIND